MPKRRKRPQHPDGWSWLCHLAAAEGIDLQDMSLAEAANRAVSQLERQQDAGLPLRPQTVHFAALLMRLEGEMAVSGATSAEPFIERAYARAHARRLGERYEARPPKSGGCAFNSLILQAKTGIAAHFAD